MQQGNWLEHLKVTEAQVVLVVDYVLYLVTGLLLWRSRVLVPLKLFAVFLHELGHATAVWLTCNKVDGIEVHADHGGLTTWSVDADHLRCMSLIVLPAGYLGSAAWGGLILVGCARDDTAQLVALLLMALLLVALGFALCGKHSRRDMTLAWLSITLLVVLGCLLWVCIETRWAYRTVLLNKVLLMVGSMNTLFSTYDIWDGCVARTVENSDAFKFAQLTRCTTPVCVGVIWLIISCLIAISMFALAMVVSQPGPKVTGLVSISPFSWVCMLIPACVCGAAFVFRCFCSSAYSRHRGIVLELEAPLGKTTPTVAPSPQEESADKAVVVTTGHHAVDKSWLGDCPDCLEDSSGSEETTP